ncbi:MAG: zinc-binding dehydrogenase [Planctomycetota bacterium]|nr:zinc-binding dehydrogenase [Planctomycetota bacterium]
MQAVVVREHGGFDKLLVEQLPTPEPGPAEVRIKIAAVGLNHLDTWVRRGVPGHQFPLPLILGSDGAGTVDAVGEGVTAAAAGDEVIVLPGLSCGTCDSCQSGHDQLCADYGVLGETRDGCCAESVVVPEANVAPKPPSLDFQSAASFSLTFQTAWSMLRRARLQAGETVLVQGAGSGVGTAAVQIARFLGAEVIATAGTDAKCQAALDLGANHAICYEQQDFVAGVREIRGRSGVDVVFEHVGASTFDGSIRCLTRGGRLVTCGATTGGEVQLSLHRLFFKNLSVIGNTMGTRDDALEVIRLAGSGSLRPVVDRVLPMAEVHLAHELLESRSVFGKIVLTP